MVSDERLDVHGRALLRTFQQRTVDMASEQRGQHLIGVAASCCDANLRMCLQKRCNEMGQILCDRLRRPRLIPPPSGHMLSQRRQRRLR